MAVYSETVNGVQSDGSSTHGVSALDFGVLPPSSNTGAVETLDITDRLHWAALTLGDDQPLSAWDQLLGGPQEWVDAAHGLNGYQSMKIAGKARLCYDGNPGMGSHLILSGAACDELYESGAVADWSDWASLALSIGAHATRLDMARDVMGDWLTVDEIDSLWCNGAVSTRQRIYDYQRHMDCGDAQGATVYIGSPKSEQRLRVYDKAAELCKGADDVQAALAEHGPHVRVELQYRGDKAKLGLLELAGHGFTRLGQLLFGHVEFKAQEARGLPNPQRVEPHAAWLAMCRTVTKKVLSVAAIGTTVERAVDWLEHQCAPTLMMVLQAFDNDWDELGRIVRLGARRMKDRHKAAVAEFRDRWGKRKAAATILDGSGDDDAEEAYLLRVADALRGVHAKERLANARANVAAVEALEQLELLPGTRLPASALRPL